MQALCIYLLHEVYIYTLEGLALLILSPASKCAHDCRQLLFHGMPDDVQTAETVHPIGHGQMDHPLWKMSAVFLSH